MFSLSLGKRNRAFTIIELLVVIVVISVLATIGIVSYNKVQASTRDTQRSTRITLISESLENYYSNNGEYPTCSVMQQSPSIVASSVLPGLTPDVLATPTAPNGTNSIVACEGEPSSDVYHYIGDTTSYTLKYKEESSGNIVSVNNRHSLPPVPAPIPDVPTFPITVNPPVANVVHVDPPTKVKCNAGDPEYHFRYRVNNSSEWIVPGAWDVSQSAAAYDLTTQQGKKYGLQMQARCKELNSVSVTIDSPESIAIAPITTTLAGPTVTTNTVADTTTWSWNDQSGTCPVDTTTNYQYRYTISPAGYDSGWIDNGSNLSVAFTTSVVGQTYTVEVQSRCNTDFANGEWGVSGSVGYVKTSGPGQLSRFSMMGSHICVIDSGDNGSCWGKRGNGQIGDNANREDRPMPTSIDKTGVLAGLTIKSISAGGHHTCAIASDDNAYCWGSNEYGSVGDGTSGDRLVPTSIDKTGVLAGLTIKSISAGAENTCAIASDNYAYCWGYNYHGEIGDGTSGTNRLSPTAVDKTGVLAGLTIKSISAGEGQTCAIASDDNAYCWGQNGHGELGNGSSGASVLVPTAVDKTGVLAGLTIKSISATYSHTCAIASDNNAYCWGINLEGQLGDGTSGTDRLVPTAIDRTGVLAGLTIKSIATGEDHNCVVASDDNAYCWGLDGPRIGDGITGATRLSPVAVKRDGALNGLTIKAITAGFSSTCAIASDDNIYCWGDDSYGQLGDGVMGNAQSTPTIVRNTTVKTNTISDNTTWSMYVLSIAPCSSRYQYRYTISPSGYDSGWVDNGNNPSVSFTTGLSGQIYKVQFQYKCSDSEGWSPAYPAALMTPLIPTGYITSTGTTAPTITAYTNISHTVAAYDSTYYVAGANSYAQSFYNMTDMPSDFNAARSLTCNIRYKITPLSNDTEKLSIRIYKSDRTTPLTDSITIAETTTPIAEVSSGNIPFMGVDLYATKADWDGAVIKIMTNHTVSGGKDNSVWSINEIEIGGVYQ